MALSQSARAAMRQWRRVPGWAIRATPRQAHAVRGRAWWAMLAAALLLASGLLTSCTTYKGALTYLDSVDLYPVGNWSPYPAQNHVGVGNGIYLMPSKHLILIHVFVPASITSLGPGAVHGAVGVWWIALDDRIPNDGPPQWMPSCAYFRTGPKGATFDLAGEYLDGPAAANLSRYPISINPEDSSISVALAPADEIHIARTSVSEASLAPAGHQTCVAP